MRLRGATTPPLEAEYLRVLRRRADNATGLRGWCHTAAYGIERIEADATAADKGSRPQDLGFSLSTQVPPLPTACRLRRLPSTMFQLIPKPPRYLRLPRFRRRRQPTRIKLVLMLSPLFATPCKTAPAPDRPVCLNCWTYLRRFDSLSFK